FFALDRPSLETVGIVESKTAGGQPCLKFDPPGRTDSAKSENQFFGLAVETKSPPAATVPLFEYVDSAGDRRAYSTDRNLHLSGFQRNEKPLCYVWQNPWRKMK